MVTVQTTTYEEERFGMSGYKMVHVGREGDVNRVIPVRSYGITQTKQEVVAEGKAQPKYSWGLGVRMVLQGQWEMEFLK